MPGQDSHDSLSAIEKQGDRFERGIDKLVKQNSEVILSINQLATEIKVGLNVQQKSNGSGSNWHMFAIMVTLLLAGMGMLFQGQLIVAKSLKDHIDLPWHPEAGIKSAVLASHVSRLDKEIEKLDVTLQSEMQLTSKATQAAIDSLDATLQREIVQLIENQAAHSLAESRLSDARLAGLEIRLSGAERDLDSRAGLRFNMPDFDRLVLPRIESIEKRIGRQTVTEEIKELEK